jgi:RNA polymerase sigma-70 factor (ECF subfamily)
VFFALVPSEALNKKRKEQLNDEITRLMGMYGSDVLRIAYLYLRDLQRAEDAFQEVFVKVYKNYDRFQGRSSEKTWIMKITINLCNDMLRSPWIKKVVPFLRSVPKQQTVDDVAYTIIATEQQKQLFVAVMGLDAVFKDVIILYYYEQFSTQEVANLLGIAEGTVRSRLHRAREQLKQTIAERREYFEST